MSENPLRKVLELLPTAFHRVGCAGDILHAPLGLSSGMRGLLLSLQYFGPTSVSKLAAMRPVSRQFVQKLTDHMLANQWVRTLPNPHHKRSPLIDLTDKGRAALDAMECVEAPYMLDISRGLDPADLAIAARVLMTICERLSPQVLEQLEFELAPDSSGHQVDA